MPDIRNIGILAHVDAGKTTLTEQLLYLCGAVRQPGNVDEGTAQTDWLEVEKRRGISVKTACARLEYGGGVVQLIDTPGHVDFAGEVERSLAALDGAVLVLSAVDLCGRPYLSWDAEFTVPRLGDMDTEMAKEFFYAVSYAAAMNLHLKVLTPGNNHHMMEAMFKAFGKALDMAVSPESRTTEVLSTKGSL